MVAVLASCTGSLSDAQRKRIRESMEQGEIKKFSEATITEAAFDYGRKVAALVDKGDGTLIDAVRMDSISQAFQIEIILLHSENQDLRTVERQLLEAYMDGGASDDNIQKMGPDSLLYTKPVLRKHADGSAEFMMALGIRMTRKQVVLSIKD